MACEAVMLTRRLGLDKGWTVDRACLFVMPRGSAAATLLKRSGHLNSFEPAQRRCGDPASAQVPQMADAAGRHGGERAERKTSATLIEWVVVDAGLLVGEAIQELATRSPAGPASARQLDATCPSRDAEPGVMCIPRNFSTATPLVLLAGPNTSRQLGFPSPTRVAPS